MAPSLSENTVRCIAGIREAFAGCSKPSLENLVPENGGIDDPYAALNWGHLKASDVEDLGFFSSTLAEDLRSMSPAALLYFIPSVMVLFLRRPDSVDFSGFIRIIRFFEDLPGCPEEGENHQKLTFNPAQANAVRGWFDQLLENLPQFDLDSSRTEYAQRLQSLRSAVPRCFHLPPPINQ